MTPKTNAIKLLEGNRGKRPLNLDEDLPLVLESPTPPPGLKGEGLKQWRWLEAELLKRRALTTADRAIMILTCEAWVDWLKLKAICRGKKKPTFSQRGTMGQRYQKPHAEFAMRDHAEKKYFRYLAEFGLTAATRTRVKALATAKRTGVNEFFQ